MLGNHCSAAVLWHYISGIEKQYKRSTVILKQGTEGFDDNLIHVMRKLTFCICKNKGADQLRSNCEADQRFCFRYMDSTFHIQKTNILHMQKQRRRSASQ